MANWRETLALLFGPGQFGGVVWSDWRRMLAENGYRIDARFLIRALSASGWAFKNRKAARRERQLEPLWATAQPHPPLFVLGHWRSGTTHLHNLLALDERFAFPNLYQCLFPSTFLSTEVHYARRLGRYLSRQRLMDSMAQDVTSANEDEFAICIATGCSSYMSMAFPRRAAHYDRFLTLRDVTDDELARWKAGLLTFVKKLTWKYGRPLVLKSPPHTARIKLLLELFPDASFVHVHRHPLAVFQSMRKLNWVCQRYIALQVSSDFVSDERVLVEYRTMHDAFHEQRPLVPPGRFHELRFGDLEQDPVGQLEALYRQLGLPDFNVVRPKVEAYIASLAGYRKNAFPDLPPTLRRAIERRWEREFELWGYSSDAVSASCRG
jgi:hypothetical protein